MSGSAIHNRQTKDDCGMENQNQSKPQRAGEICEKANPAEAEIAMLRDRLRQASAMASLGELTSTATHEFNNVLMTILNYAQMGMRNRDDATRDKALSRIHDAAKRASTITQTILAQARNRGDERVPTQLAGLVQDALVLLSRELNKYRIHVETDLDESVPAVMASGNQIQRVLINLIINARQAMDEGGTLAVRVAKSASGGGVDLMVRDSGCGMDAATAERIFEPFFSTKVGPDASGRGGSGLGLAASKEIIDSHGGRIRVESTPGRGTAIVIFLPTASDQQAAA